MNSLQAVHSFATSDGSVLAEKGMSHNYLHQDIAYT